MTAAACEVIAVALAVLLQGATAGVVHAAAPPASLFQEEALRPLMAPTVGRPRYQRVAVPAPAAATLRAMAELGLPLAEAKSAADGFETALDSTQSRYLHLVAPRVSGEFVTVRRLRR